MRSPHATLCITVAATLLALSLGGTQSANARSGVKKLSLQGWALLNQYEDDMTFVAFPLTLNLSPFTFSWMDTSETRDLQFSIWEKNELLEKSRPHHRLQLFNRNQNSFELWGAQVMKSEVRFRLSELDSLLGKNSAFSVTWGRGSVAAMTETTLDLGSDFGDASIRVKVEFRKEPKPDTRADTSRSGTPNLRFT
jgi:hypothetical protein